MPKRTFAEVIADVDDGKLSGELDAKLAEVTRAVDGTRKPGSIKLTLKIAPGGRGTIVVAHKLDATVPEDKYATTFFVGDNGELQRHDPNQPKLDLRQVDEPKAPLRDVDDGKVQALRAAKG